MRNKVFLISGIALTAILGCGARCHDEQRRCYGRAPTTAMSTIFQFMRSEAYLSLRSITLVLGLSMALLAQDSFGQDSTPTNADIQSISDRLSALEAENKLLKSRALEAEKTSLGSENTLEPTQTRASVIGTNAAYNFQLLDHAENTNTKQLLQLRAIQDGGIENTLIIGGQITSLINYQKANEDTKFGWLMRHPTSSNQIGKEVSEAVVHSANLNFTARLSDSITGYVEMLYNPEQNFAADSTITGLPRNNVSVRRAYVLWGNLDSSPAYASLGKIDIPFGLNDTVSPFTNSTNWHSFAGLAYGANLGFAGENFHLRAMAIQGGAQFRNANTSVGETNVPSKLNNFALDANYTFVADHDSNVNIGLSYQYGSSYCQSYNDTPSTAHSTPTLILGVTRNIEAQGVKHFASCKSNNDAIAGYVRYEGAKTLIIAEYAKTLDVWPGTLNPYLPQFIATDSEAFTIGGRYSMDLGLATPVDFSAEFSRFSAGPSGAPWEKQDQLVFGLSHYLSPNINLFSEIILVDGWVPLNFLSGGNPGSLVGTSWSSQTSETKIFMLGIQAAF